MMKRSPAYYAAVALGLAGLLTACSHAKTQSSVASATASPSTIVYPAGIVPPADWHAQTHNGVYAADSAKQCCFLAGRAVVTLDNPPGAQRAVFSFYVPAVKPFEHKTERVTVAFNGKQAGAPADLPTGAQSVIFTIPPALRNKPHIVASLKMSTTWVPRRIGLNADGRVLSIMLTQVGYI
jgi:hypothetical protein